jgi:hypothetical protein
MDAELSRMCRLKVASHDQGTEGWVVSVLLIELLKTVTEIVPAEDLCRHVRGFPQDSRNKLCSGEGGG